MAQNVNETELAVRLEAHDHEIGSLKHRMKSQEEQSKAINDLVLSVQKLALNMEQMINEQKEQRERLQELEQEPGRKWRRMGDKAWDTVVGIVFGGIVTGLILMVAQYIN